MKDITQLTPATDPITTHPIITTNPIMAIPVRLPLPLATGHIMFAAPVTGTAAGITPGEPVNGGGAMVSGFGSTGATWCEDTKLGTQTRATLLNRRLERMAMPSNTPSLSRLFRLRVFWPLCSQDASLDFAEANAVTITLTPAGNCEGIPVFEPFTGFTIGKL